MTPSENQGRGGIVYIAVNRTNKKAYIGKTQKSLSDRFYEHKVRAKLGYRSFFYSAIRKYGFESFDVAVLAEHLTLESLNLAEKEWIKKIGSLAPVGYNISRGGEGASIPGHLKSDSWRQSVTSESYRSKKSEMMRATRASLSPEKKESWRVNAAAANAGKERPAQRGEGNVSKRPEVREKIRLSKLGKARPMEMVQRMAETIRKRWADPECRARFMANRATQKMIRKNKTREATA